jgi:dipeptidyl aminopeptidase/acylaminoacyl peptidase
MTLPSWARDEPERLIYTSNANGKFEVYAWDRQADTHRQVTDRPEGTIYAAIDPPGETIWWFDDEKGSEFGRWMLDPFGVPADGAITRPAAPGLPPAYPAGLSLGRSLSLIGTSKEDGSRVHLLSGDRDQPTLLYEHQEDAEVAGLSRDERLWCLQHSEHGDARHPAIRILGTDGQALADLWDGPGLGLWSAGWSPVPGDQRLLVLHERRDLPRPMVWMAETDETIDLELDLPGEVDASWYPDATALLIAHDHRGRVELYRLDVGSSKLEPLDVEPGTIVAARIRPDGELWYHWSNSSTPSQVRTTAGVLVSPPGEPAPAGAAYRDYDVDGIHGFIAEPPGSSRPHPTLFFIHGGPESHDRDAFFPAAQAWVDHGFAVVFVNYRGSTGYGKAWRDALEHNPGLTELKDIAKVHDWVVKEGIADPTRIVLSGASWGGYLTLLGLGIQPERWSLGIAGVPVADYVAAFEDEMDPLKAFDRAVFGGTPEEIPDVYAQRSPITFVDRVRVPVMILAGENDPRCPIRQIDNYIRRLEELGSPHEVYRYDAGHGSLVIDEAIRQTEAQIDFAARHLGTPSPR